MGCSKPGSPPRVRGKVRRVLGKLAASVDHPRVCGEKDCSAPCAHGRWGSPPRVRGKERCGRANRMSKGITPACAGKSIKKSVKLQRGGDHPRVCGEKFRFLLVRRCFRGSPPRVRGKVLLYCYGLSQVGITPACAGKSLCKIMSVTPSRDHPRVCGEKVQNDTLLRTQKGSPPRVRGKARSHAQLDNDTGITPACAGKRPAAAAPVWGRRDHPRVCGEKLCSLLLLRCYLGSPPRVRGKVPFQYALSSLLGITPACAGKRLKRSHSIGHFSCILCLFHSVLHRASVSGGSRAGPCAPPCLPAQNAVPV